jgi:hypothetical protein
MAAHEVVRLIRDLHRANRFAAFDADRQGFMDAYDLTAEERAALAGNDVAALYAMGVHPMAVLFFSQDNHMPMPDYLSAIGAAQSTVDELRRLFGPRAAAAAGIVPSDRDAGEPET